MARFPVLLDLIRCWPIMENARFSARIGHTGRMVRRFENADGADGCRPEGLDFCARQYMKKAELKTFGTPDEVREFPKGRLELIRIGGATVGRAIFEPGWRWATSLQPLMKTKSCDAPHFQYHVSGLLRIRMDDGTEFDCRPGDVSLLPSGHDAWVVGNEPAVVVDFQGMIDYAKSL